MHQIAPDDLSAALAELGGWRRISSPLLATTEEIHQAVRRRIKVDGGGEPAAAPRVVVINLSLADETRPVARIMIMSPNVSA
jgi:hypothetical protein